MSKLKTLLELDKSTEIKNFNGSNFKKTHILNGWTVRPTIHAASQAKERRPDHTENDWFNLHSKMINHIVVNDTPSGDHAFYSKSTRQGYIASVNNANKNINIITVLPAGHSRTKAGTDKHLLENSDIKIIFLD